MLKHLKVAQSLMFTDFEWFNEGRARFFFFEGAALRGCGKT